ncbi:metal ABC transporter solute-binding protein, Zn/Mn family [Planctomicrobium sp. SH664]|uniref:metal ABC transporter solute-binding protein, Zn/Mn family n=1 Tax=Planctomicrobium sp. SH664 TaxID=3448125 RepID=UPI003F5BA9D3
MLRFPGLLGLLCLFLCGCPRSTPPAESTPSASPPLKIVTTTAMVKDLVSHVAGSHAQVTSLMGEGVDPHLYRPTAQDMGELLKADLVFYSGLMLEGRMQTAFEKAKSNGKVVEAVTAKLPQESLRFPAEFEGHPDPHVWNDAGTWAKCLDHVVSVLSEKEPQLAAEFAANAKAYGETLQGLDNYARTAIASIPKESRYLVTAHDAFGYFSRAYDIEERSVQGITTDSEAGVKDIQNLVDFLVEKKVPALFVEATVNSANLKAVMEGARHKGWEVREGGTLYSDSMGQPDTYEGTYVGMLDHNVTTIVRALGGKAPEKGLNGQLGSTVK